LLEVLGRQGKPAGKGFTAPEWWKSGIPDRAARAASPDDLTPEPAAARPGRIRLGPLRISPIGAVVTVGALAIAVLITVQSVGLREREQRDADLLAEQGQSIDALRRQSPHANALDVLLARTPDSDGPLDADLTSIPSGSQGAYATARPAAAEPSAGRQPGLNYVVVETFRGDDATAEAQSARKFLQENDIHTTIEPMGDRLCLVTQRGFQARDPQMSTFCQRIERLGQAYFAAGGKYRFKGCYGKLYRSSGW
jgi:hypothetical protein